MTKKTKRRSLLALLVGSVLLAGVTAVQPPSHAQTKPSPARTGVQRLVRQEADPHEGSTILVEAFVVEVSLSALSDMGVNPLGQAPHSVSVQQLLTCLRKDDSAGVLLGVKTAGAHASRGNTTEETETTYRSKTRTVNTREGQTEHVDYTPYENGQVLSVQPAIRPDGTVELGYDFSYSGVRAGEQGAEAPPNTVSWSWNGSVSLQAGTPAIVGATQDQDGAIFLVLTAHIQN